MRQELLNLRMSDFLAKDDGKEDALICYKDKTTGEIHCRQYVSAFSLYKYFSTTPEFYAWFEKLYAWQNKRIVPFEPIIGRGR